MGIHRKLVGDRGAGSDMVSPTGKHPYENQPNGQFFNLKRISYLTTKITENTLHSLLFFHYFVGLSLLVAIFSSLILTSNSGKQSKK